MLLAEFAPLSPSDQSAIVSILSVLALIVTVWGILRRKPPLDTELLKLQTAIEALKAAVDKVTAAADEHAGHQAEITSLKSRVSQLEAARERDLAAQREYTKDTAEIIFAKIDALTASVSTNFQSVERAIGQLEGTVRSLADR